MSKDKNRLIHAVTLPDGRRFEKEMLVQQRSTGGVATILRFTSESTAAVVTKTPNGGLFVSHAELELLDKYELPESAESEAEESAEKTESKPHLE